MSLRVARGVYNPEKDRFHYYVAFKPALDPTMEERGVEHRYPVDVAFSVTETGELADLAFSLPKPCCSLIRSGRRPDRPLTATAPGPVPPIRTTRKIQRTTV